ncbi:hypothetical protein CYMTET_16946 [Cymbomonas tetramitiformis]|uniref:Uncharacterized protein n=1 Tax=Cymbomonas tetramitiformis TaxID=36881 RepID=A0AAE0GB86_9CHLO|nr:hypothetical protein CYMTET_16946 [Cymbomonas tetramitiformis]
MSSRIPSRRSSSRSSTTPFIFLFLVLSCSLAVLWRFWILRLRKVAASEDTYIQNWQHQNAQLSKSTSVKVAPHIVDSSSIEVVEPSIATNGVIGPAELGVLFVDSLSPLHLGLSCSSRGTRRLQGAALGPVAAARVVSLADYKGLRWGPLPQLESCHSPTTRGCAGARCRSSSRGTRRLQGAALGPVAAARVVALADYKGLRWGPLPQLESCHSPTGTCIAGQQIMQTQFEEMVKLLEEKDKQIRDRDKHIKRLAENERMVPPPCRQSPSGLCKRGFLRCTRALSLDATPLPAPGRCPSQSTPLPAPGLPLLPQAHPRRPPPGLRSSRPGTCRARAPPLPQSTPPASARAPLLPQSTLLESASDC